MGIILDVAVICIIAFYVFTSARRGFIRTLIETVGFVLIILLANSICTPLANSTYDKFLEPAVVKAVEKIDVDNVTEFAEDKSLQTENSSEVTNKLPAGVNISTEKFNEITDKVFARAPFLGESIKSNSDVLEDFEKSINKEIDKGLENAVKNASQTVIKPLFSIILSMVYSILITIGLMFFVKIIARIVNKFITHTFLKSTNSFLGGFLGIIKGAVVCTVLCTIISLVVSLTANGIWIFTPAAIESSVIFEFLCF